MMTIIDILIYVAFAFFASSLAKKSENYIEEYNIPPTCWDRYLTYFVLFFTVISAIRWDVGTDNVSYALTFDYKHILPSSAGEKEKLWWFFVHSLRDLQLHWSIGLGVCAFFQFWFLTKALQTNRWLLAFVPLVLFGGRYWMDIMGAIRQMIVASMFLWASRFIYTRQIWKYMLTIVAGVFIHQSALLLLPFYFIPLNISIEKNRAVLIAILIVCFIIGQTPAFQGVVNYFQFISSSTNYDNYTDVMSGLLMEGETKEALSYGPMMLSYLLIPIFIIWFGPELKEKYSDKIPYFNIWFNLAFFYACAYFLVCNISHLFIRPVLYFSLFQMIMAALLLYYLWFEYKKYGRRQTITLIFCCIIAINTAWNITKASNLRRETVTYKVSFLNQDKVRWFNL